ncbi:lanthionine synthetase C family protein [Clostridium sp. C8-1-8]|uniref:lanthionine synthetase C family protein n=1 Tax=Clostridium sp. C8-1-8 TaxID=2698831 RepID=UPI00136C6818|nr:lanthionine synthetase C family protein [Clostridium sp. C8-1-8]
MYKEEIRDFILKLLNIVTDIDNFEEKMNLCASWEQYFLYSGYPEIILYLSQVEEDLINRKFDVALRHYIGQFKKNIQVSQPYLKNKTGMLYGYCGIGLMLLELRKNGMKVEKLLNSVNEIVYSIIIKKIQRAEKSLENYDISYEDYDCIEGLASSLRYLVEFKESDKFNMLINKVLKYLVNLTKCNKYDYPNYYVKPGRLDELRKRRNPNGIIDYGMAHGLAGILSSLAIVKINGFEVIGMEEAISTLLQELKSSMKNINGINYWPSILSIDDYLNNKFNDYNLDDYGWCYGVTGVARAMYLGGQALNDPTYIELAIDTFKQVSINLERVNMSTYIICHGYSGVLVILNEMYEDTKVEAIKEAADVIVNKILEWLQSSKVLEDLNKTESRGESSIDLWEGIIGIALALINYNNKSKDVIAKLMLVR